jgi:hypothetical protein
MAAPLGNLLVVPVDSQRRRALEQALPVRIFHAPTTHRVGGVSLTGLFPHKRDGNLHVFQGARDRLGCGS